MDLPLTDLEKAYVALAERDAQTLLLERVKVLVQSRGLDILKGQYRLDAEKGILVVPDLSPTT